MISSPDIYRRLVETASGEPPRVRAILGALGEDAGASEAELRRLHGALNPISRFEFGVFRALPSARNWQAK